MITGTLPDFVIEAKDGRVFSVVGSPVCIQQMYTVCFAGCRRGQNVENSRISPFQAYFPEYLVYSMKVDK